MCYAVVCDNPTICQRLETALRQSRPGHPMPQVVLPQNALQLATKLRSEGRNAAVFFGSMEFTPEELALLKQLCHAAGERIRVVAVGPTFGPDLILQTIRCGAVDYLDITAHFNRELENLLERLSASNEEHADAGRMFTVVSAVGGSGASTLAVNIAATIAKQFASCGLLDLQLGGGHLAALLQLSPRHTVVSLAEKMQQLDRAMLEQALVAHGSGIRLLAGPEQFCDLRHFSGQVIQKIVELAKSALPHIVVDLEDCAHTEQVRAAANSEKLIIPFRLDYVSLLQTKELVDLLLSGQFTRSQLVLVASRYGQAKELPLDSIEDVLGVPVEHRIPNDPAAVNASCNLGEPYVLASPRSPASLSVIRLTEHLLGAALEKKPATSSLSTILSKLPATGQLQKLFRSASPGIDVPLPEAGEA